MIQAYKSRSSSFAEGEFAASPIVVNGTDVTDLELRMSAGSSITGRVTLEGAGALRPSDIDLVPVAVNSDLSPPESARASNADIREDWTFQLAGINGPRRLRATRMPPGWTLRAIFANGVDVTDTPLPFGTKAQSLKDVDIVLTSRVTKISGKATDSRGDPATDCSVIAFSADRDRWYPDSRFLGSAPVGDDGAFTFGGLPAGDYLVAAIDSAAEWQAASFLDRLAPHATRVTLNEGEKTSVSLKR